MSKVKAIDNLDVTYSRCASFLPTPQLPPQNCKLFANFSIHFACLVIIAVEHNLIQVDAIFGSTPQPSSLNMNKMPIYKKKYSFISKMLLCNNVLKNIFEQQNSITMRKGLFS